MSMRRHRCKICSKMFNNGRALGGHMRSHLTSLPMPSKKNLQHTQLGESTQSDSSSTRSEDNELVGVKDEKFNAYGLRENPKRSSKASDPEFLDAGSVVQDTESETESTQNPTRKRSKRVGKLSDRKHEIKSESGTDSTPASSVSDPGHQDEEVALSLMMLSRDVWHSNSVANTNNTSELITTRPSGSGTRKKVCNTSNKQCQEDQIKIHECPFCYKVFGSGQALGGHKRSHLLGSSNNNNNLIQNGDNGITTSFVFDLNLPPPIDDLDF